MELIEIKKEITNQLSDQTVAAALLATTFKGLTEPTMKRAIMEGMIRGFQFKDFLEKNVYAIPYGGTYSLVTSIDHARKIGMRSGIVGKSAPTFQEADSKIVSCTITVKRKVADYVGDFTATVFMDEYSTGKNLWNSKPRTMLAKVAEMHALRWPARRK
jgi:RecT family